MALKLLTVQDASVATPSTCFSPTTRSLAE
jgi:hypothetical protein